MKILIGADIVPTETNRNEFIKGDVESLFGDALLGCLNSADYRIFNLEVPLSDEKHFFKKRGPALIAPVLCAEALKDIHIDLMTVANNHAMDQGEEGLFSTIRTLEEYGIAWSGAGKNAEEAAKPFVFQLNGMKIGVICCAEHEFSGAAEDSAGVQVFDALNTPDAVSALKKECDRVLVLYHGGKEHYHYPAPYLQKICRKLAEKGADLVITQHSHCIGCCENMNGSVIVYGQGNFLFDHSEREEWQTSLLIQWHPEDNSVEYLPVVKMKQYARLADEARGKEILSGFAKRSEEMKQPGFIERRYTEFAEEMLGNYFGDSTGKFRTNPVMRLLGRMTHGKSWRIFYGEREKLRMINIMECEAQRELYLAGLKHEVKGNKR